ncbi:ParB/RepB/Spo0J family partition protein [Candidatus Parcubacteria bacterium]|nr:MAG: ParB/RepB/Spo0J family partition protein [Candidatus Parcubacteria bacterium]
MPAPSKPFYDSIFWVEVEKIRPNPFQPRRDFDEARLRELAESVRQYGILQPLVVTRHEIESPDGSIRVAYELIAGERRWRAAKIAGLTLVPVVIRSQEESDKMKLELAIIENLQREDLNPVERALAFKKLQEYGYNNAEIARKIGRSREYVSNTLRILNLPEDILNAVRSGAISEGFTRPLLMLNDRPEEQKTLFEEILERKLSVRETERIARRIAADKTRKPVHPEISSAEAALARALGTRVMVTPRAEGNGGKIVIDYFSEEDLRTLLAKLSQSVNSPPATEPATVSSSRGGVADKPQPQRESRLVDSPRTAPEPQSEPTPLPAPAANVAPVNAAAPAEFTPERNTFSLQYGKQAQDQEPSSVSPFPASVQTTPVASAALVEPSLKKAPTTFLNNAKPASEFEETDVAPLTELEVEDVSPQEQRATMEEDDDLYAVRNFTI